MTPDSETSRGIRWGPFTARIPLIHTTWQTPEFVQGVLVTGATGLAVVPIYSELFGMSFEAGVAMAALQTVLVASAFFLFGDPFCPGWLTAMLPLVLAATARYATPPERIDFVNAIVLATSCLFLVLGITGLGARFVAWTPRALRSGIILAAGISALSGEFQIRSGDRPPRLEAYPISIAVATGVSLILLFSLPLERLRTRHRWLAILASFGIAPGYVAAMIVGPLAGELRYADFASWLAGSPVEAAGGATGFLFVPDFNALLTDFSILGRGLPAPEYWLAAAPLALAAYLVGFGDIVTGTAIIKDAERARGTQSIEFSERRTHLTLGLRNAAAVLLAGPFFPMHGPLWTGATVVVAERYREGRAAMDSLFSGIASYYMFGMPAFYFCLPLLLLFRPVLDVAFSLTLLLTGFACAYVAMAMPANRLERGIALIAAIALQQNMWLGLTAGFLLTAVLLGREGWANSREP